MWKVNTVCAQLSKQKKREFGLTNVREARLKDMKTERKKGCEMKITKYIRTHHYTRMDFDHTQRRIRDKPKKHIHCREKRNTHSAMYANDTQKSRRVHHIQWSVDTVTRFLSLAAISKTFEWGARHRTIYRT